VPKGKGKKTICVKTRVKNTIAEGFSVTSRMGFPLFPWTEQKGRKANKGTPENGLLWDGGREQVRQSAQRSAPKKDERATNPGRRKRKKWEEGGRKR